MAKQRTEKSNYPSRYAQGWVSGAQYIVEFLCECLAKQQKKDLPQNFYQLDEWKKLFRNQIAAANALIKVWPTEVVVRALKDSRVHWRIKSLRATWLLEPILKEKFAEYSKEQENLKNAPTIEKGDTLSQPQAIKGREGIVSKLSKLE